MDNKNSDRPVGRTAIVARQLPRYDIDIAALSETRFPEEEQLREDGGAYIRFWKGTSVADHRIDGVGFAIKNEIVRGRGALRDAPEPNNCGERRYNSAHSAAWGETIARYPAKLGRNLQVW